MPVLVVNIDELPAAGAIDETNLFVMATPDGVAYRVTAEQLADYFGALASGGIGTDPYTELVGGVNIVTRAPLIGKSVLVVFRSGQAFTPIASGTPVNMEVLHNPVNGQLIFDTNNPVGLNETILTLYI